MLHCTDGAQLGRNSCQQFHSWHLLRSFMHVGYWLYKEHVHDVLQSIVAHVHLLDPVQAHNLINNKLISFTHYLFNGVCKAKNQSTKSSTCMTMTVKISSLELTWLAICISVHCWLFFIQCVQEVSTLTCGKCYDCRLPSSSSVYSTARYTQVYSHWRLEVKLFPVTFHYWQTDRHHITITLI